LKDKKIKVVVGITNSADSKVAAYLLNRQGYEVLAVTFLYSPKSNKSGGHHTSTLNGINYKCDIRDTKDIKNFCQKVGIPHLGFFSYDEFRDSVIDPCIAYRLKSASDNPCFSCSRLTLTLLMEKAKELDADFISTGHYAKVHFSQTAKSYFLNAANDLISDQSFLLAKVSQNILSKLILPLGDLRKVEVKKIATRQSWEEPREEKVSSCLNGDSFNEYISHNVAPSLLKEGNVMFFHDDLNIGTHEGLHLQRFGESFIGNLYQTTAQGDYVVVDINRYNGNVYVEKSSLIFCKRIFLNDVNLRRTAVRIKPKPIIVRVEGDPKTYSAIIHFKNNDSALIILDKKINKLFASGTHVTIYEELLGGRLSVLGSGRVKYEAKFLEIDNGQDNGEKKVADFEF